MLPDMGISRNMKNYKEDVRCTDEVICANVITMLF